MGAAVLLNTIAPVTGGSRFVFKEVESLSGTRSITAADLEDYQGFAFDPNGTNRNVDLPAEATSKGAMITISNEANNVESLIIRNDGGTTIANCREDEAVVLWCDGVAWFGLIGTTSETKRYVFKGVENLSGTRSISNSEIHSYQGFAFDPNGASRFVDLPAEGQSEGAYITISNEADAAEVLTIRNDGGGTICTPTQNEAAILWCDGNSWFGLVGSSA